MDDVLVVGAGPTGLVLALWLTRQGIRVRIVDRNEGPGTTSRAMAVQARTLELYRQLDLAEPAVAAGYPNPGINLWVRGRRVGHLAFGAVGAALTPYPFILIYPQDRHERLLEARLAELGVTVERRTELIDFEDRGDHVQARLRLPDGSEDRCEVGYLAGCDGARSVVRHRIGAGFAGGTYPQVFYVADVVARGIARNGEAQLSLATSDFLALFSYGHGGLSRLIGTVRADRVENVEGLTFADVGHEAADFLGVTVEQVNWFSTYRVHHRVTDRFRRGRAFLLGDAAHVHSPAGGQGMNTGIGDAINLAWKLASVLKSRAPDSLLDSYEGERLAFARKLVDTTDRVFSRVTAEGALADVVRTRIAPILARLAYGLAPVRARLFRLVSQMGLNYRDGTLSAGRAGRVRGGDRLPWVAGDPGQAKDAPIGWQVHVYGIARADLRDWCAARSIPLHVVAWRPAHRRAGLARDAAYLLRPDTYVALADPRPGPATLERYFTTQGLAIGP